MPIETLRETDGGSSPSKRKELLILLCRVLEGPSTGGETFFEALRDTVSAKPLWSTRRDLPLKKGKEDRELLIRWERSRARFFRSMPAATPVTVERRLI